jgi:3-oxoacyl-[acyl-carrier-protein] synthase II
MKRRVVITGLGAVTPVGNDVQSTWNNLLQGVNGIGLITLFDTTNARVKIAAEIKNFNPEPYVDARTAGKLDRVITLGLMAAGQAYDDANLKTAKIDPFRFGTFVTSGIGGLDTMWKESQVAGAKGQDRISPYFIPNTIINLIGGNIAIKYQAKGPNLPIVTACSAATNSMGEAFRYIRDGYLELAFTGGSESSINPLGIGGFSVMRALNGSNDPTQASIPFDARRSGFVMGEGAGVLIFEELEHALKRGAKIYAEVVGYGSTTDAFHITAPDEEASGITYCLTQTLKDANVQPTVVDYINAHGTSTILNDKIETLGIKKAFQDHAYRLNISSTKSMTGHMLGATGAIESMVCVLALRDNKIPPTINYQVQDPLCDLNYTPNKMVERSVQYAMNINVGFGGQNAALLFKKWTGPHGA